MEYALKNYIKSYKMFAFYVIMKGSSMPKKKESSDKELRSMPALTPEGQENRMISLAMDCAEQQLRDGSASSAVIVHFLKLGTEKSKLEREKLEYESELLRVKAKSIEASSHSDELTNRVLDALKRYGGGADED